MLAAADIAAHHADPASCPHVTCFLIRAAMQRIGTPSARVAPGIHAEELFQAFPHEGGRWLLILQHEREP